jgi:twitching motility protein PilT
VDREGRVLATEVLLANPAIRSQIRERKTSQLRSTIEMGRADGMHTMDRRLRDLYQQGIVTYDTAISHAMYPETIQVAVGANGAAKA